MKKAMILKNFTIFVVFFFQMIPAFAENVSINGFITQGYMKSNKNNYLAETEDGTFQLNEMGLKFSTRLPGRLTLGMQFFARDLGDFGNDEINIDWAFADYRYKPWLGVQAGKLKKTFGLYNESRDIEAMRTSIFLPSSVYNETWRDTFVNAKGVAVYGHLFDHVSYKLQGGHSGAPMDGGMAKMYSSFGAGELAKDLVTDIFIGSIQVYDFIIEGLKFAYSYYHSEFDLDLLIKPSPQITLPSETTGIADSVIYMWVSSVEYSIYNLKFAAEYSYLNMNADLNVMILGSMLTLPMEYDAEAWYANLSYRFTDWFEMGIYYSAYYWGKDKKDRAAIANMLSWPYYHTYNKDTCLSFRFDLNDNWMVKMDTHMNTGTGTVFLEDNRNDDGTLDLAKHFNVFVVKVIYSF